MFCWALYRALKRPALPAVPVQAEQRALPALLEQVQNLHSMQCWSRPPAAFSAYKNTTSRAAPPSTVLLTKEIATGCLYYCCLPSNKFQVSSFRFQVIHCFNLKPETCNMKLGDWIMT